MRVAVDEINDSRRPYSLEICNSLIPIDTNTLVSKPIHQRRSNHSRELQNHSPLRNMVRGSSYQSNLFFVDSQSARSKAVRSHIVREAIRRRTARRLEGLSAFPQGCNTSTGQGTEAEDGDKWAWRLPSPASLLETGFSGMRSDAFNAYPIVATAWVYKATDFCAWSQ